MRRSLRPSAAVYALYLNAALLLIIIGVLAGRGGGLSLSSAAFAGQPPQPIAGGGGIFLMPGQFSMNTWGCYVMDVDTQTLCAYQFYPGEKQLRLVASRSFRHDRKLENFNTIPAPSEVEKLVELQKSGGRAATQKAGPAPDSRLEGDGAAPAQAPREGP